MASANLNEARLLINRLAQVEEIAQSICDYVHENEPGVLKYQWFRAGGTEKPTIVVWETYDMSVSQVQNKSRTDVGPYQIYRPGSSGNTQVKLQDGLACGDLAEGGQPGGTHQRHAPGAVCWVVEPSLRGFELLAVSLSQLLADMP